MAYSLVVTAVVILCTAYYLFERSRIKAVHLLIVQRQGCQPLKCLPNKWFPPFGLDKLEKVTEAERTGTYPLLMMSDHEKYGDTYAQWSGPLYTVITRDTSNIRSMLSEQFKSFELGSGRSGCVRPLLGSGIFTQDGKQWEASRRLLAPMIQRPVLPDLGLAEKHFQLFQQAMKFGAHSTNLAAEASINVKEHFLNLSLKMITEFLLGESLDATVASTTTNWINQFAAEFNVAFKWISMRERLKAFYWIVDGFQFRGSCKAAQSLVDEVVYRAIEVRKLGNSSEQESYVALENLLRKERDPEPIRDHFMNLLLAGRDSSGALLCWIFYALAREPRLVADLRLEIESILGTDESRKPDKRELNAMVKMDQLVCETEQIIPTALRLFPPVPLNGRFSLRDTHLPRGGGDDGQSPILIPKGTLIAFSTFAAQRNQDLYGEDASRFKIERWTDKMSKERRMVDWSYHPFLGGPRKCLGERLAVTQAKYLTCRVLQHFHQIIPTDGKGNALPFGRDGSWVDDVKYHVNLTMMPEAGVWLRLVPKI